MAAVARELFSSDAHCCTMFSPMDEKDVHLPGQHCPIPLLNVKIMVFYDAMPCSLVNRYQGSGGSLLSSSSGYETTTSKMLVHTYQTSINPLMTDAAGSSGTFLYAYKITRYHIPQKDHLHNNA